MVSRTGQDRVETRTEYDHGHRSLVCALNRGLAEAVASVGCSASEGPE